MKLGACNMRRMQSLLCVEEHLLNWRNTLQYYELGTHQLTPNNPNLQIIYTSHSLSSHQFFKYDIRKNTWIMNIHVAIDIHRPSGGSEQWTFLKIQSEDFIMPSIEMMMIGFLFVNKTTGSNRIFFSIWSNVLHFWSGVRNNRYYIED